jgi:2-C-methyl-D-erythritol 4-phosphate cytidylyltransferase
VSGRKRQDGGRDDEKGMKDAVGMASSEPQRQQVVVVVVNNEMDAIVKLVEEHTKVKEPEMEEIHALFNGLSLHNDDRQRLQPQKAQQHGHPQVIVHDAGRPATKEVPISLMTA